MDYEKNTHKSEIIKIVAIIWAIFSTVFLFINDKSVAQTTRIEKNITILDKKISNYLYLIHDLDKRLTLLENK